MKIVCSFLLCMCCTLLMAQSPTNFIVNPYLQVGYNPAERSLQLLWQTNDEEAVWSVQYTNSHAEEVAIVSYKRIAVAGIPAHRIYAAALKNLAAGGIFTYSIRKNNQIVFSAKAQAPKSYNQPYSFVVFGDVGAGTPEARAIAEGVYKANSDIVFIPGDIVYDNGLVKEYRKRFWPIYNAAVADTNGFPIMSRIPFVAATGNHDADTRDLDKKPDALAYYYYWQQPLNGPKIIEGSNLIPALKADETNRSAFIEAAGAAYPGMTNFSYNYANAHWLIIDADNYADVSDTTLTNWISRDLEAAKNYEWKFVMFHHPGFNSSVEHYEQQQTRLLAPLFEKGKVDIVFAGHVHNYQRSYPLTFKPDGKGISLTGGREGKMPRGKIVNGHWHLDKLFNGANITKTNGVIYIVTGAGGQDLYNPEQQNDKDSWQGFTARFVSQVHTFTKVAIENKTLVLSQLTAKGVIVDTFTLTHD